MSRMIGTTSRGVRIPIIKEGDDLVNIVSQCVFEAGKEEGFSFHDRDVVGITEAVVARAQGNYATTEQIAKAIKNTFSCDTLGLVFPIMSRNRFSVVLRGIAMGVKKIVLMLSYPSDEVGNHLVSLDALDEKGINPWSDVLTEEDFRKNFGIVKHEFTGVDYIQFYKELIQSANCEAEIILANNPKAILSYTKNVLACDIHTRKRTKRILQKAGAEKVFTLDEIMTKSVDGSGYCDFGLLGSNKATDDRIKLFPRDCQAFVDKTAQRLKELTGKNIEVMIYGDGAFKDPVGKIWELADPVVSPAYTKGLVGTPNELKLKYLADNDFKDLSGDELKDAMKKRIQEKNGDLKGQMASQGTTPRQLTDLIGSLCDLTSGSGDKGTPVILVQGYFDNYASEE